MVGYLSLRVDGVAGSVSTMMMVERREGWRTTRRGQAGIARMREWPDRIHVHCICGSPLLGRIGRTVPFGLILEVANAISALLGTYRCVMIVEGGGVRDASISCSRGGGVD